MHRTAVGIRVERIDRAERCFRIVVPLQEILDQVVVLHVVRVNDLGRVVRDQAHLAEVEAAREIIRGQKAPACRETEIAHRDRKQLHRVRRRLAAGILVAET